jgi:hypothetical protein
VNNQADSILPDTNSEFECGHDFVGSVIPLLMVNHQEGFYEFKSRKEGRKLIESLAK